MRLDDYFLFVSEDDIRIKGSGVSVAHVLYHYLYRFETPEAIAARFPTLQVKHVYVAITYYWCEQEAMAAHVARWLERTQNGREQQAAFTQGCRAGKENAVQAA
jgi:uncharacterized protein (DUF433 family)